MTVAKTTPTRTVRALRLRAPRSKYRNIKTAFNGITFDSRAESDRYVQLLLQEKAGIITGLVCQPSFEIHPAFTDNEGKRHRKICYIGDFQYTEAGQVVVEDVKGRETEAFKIKAKLFRARYPGIKFVIVQA